MNGQKIPIEYLDKLKTFFTNHCLEEIGVTVKNEATFCEFLGAKTFKFTNSGTSSLYIIMKYLVDRGAKRIWGPAFTHISWINCANWLDISYDLVDVSIDTLSLCPKRLVEKLNSTPHHLLPNIIVMVDMGGYVGEDTIKIREICDSYNITMIEDSAHAFGQKYEGKFAGTFGHYGFFSFSNPKILTVGEGGAIVSSYEDIDVILSELIYQGGWYKYGKESYTMGLNFIMSNWLTELLLYQLQDLPLIQKVHQDKYNEIISRNQSLFCYESDNELYAPSFFVFRKSGTVKSLIEKVPQLLMERYKNMGSPSFTNSQSLQETLVYYRHYMI